MRASMELLERSMMRQGVLLVGRACTEREGPAAVVLVERVVAFTKEGGKDSVDFLFGSAQWQKFRVLYPVAAARLEKGTRS